MKDLLIRFNDLLQKMPWIHDAFYLVFMLIIAYLSLKITLKIGLKYAKSFSRKTKTPFDDLLIEHKVLHHLAFFIPLLVIKNLSFLTPLLQATLDSLVDILMIFLTARFIASLLNAANGYYELKPRAKTRPIKSYLQVIIIIVYIFSLILIVGILIHQSPWMLLSGIGAATAIVLLIFKDTILSFVAGMQINMYDLLHVGDWIEMPQFGADGDVIDIALHTIKVQNWDKSITIIPTHKLLDNSFRNWRGMEETGGRRIKRAIYLDQNSVRFCDEQMIERFRKIHLISDYVERKLQELEQYNKKHHIDDSVKVNGRRMTNLGTFRVYAAEYIKHHPKIHQGLTKMVRQLPPGPQGLPIEIYAFTSDINWENYEAIQADIFDHLLAVVPEFDLRIFQNPSGRDFTQWSAVIRSRK